jgi:hypothetical protein
MIIESNLLGISDESVILLFVVNYYERRIRNGIRRNVSLGGVSK